MTRDVEVTHSVLEEIDAERAAQDEKWGQQNHRDGTSAAYRHLADGVRDIADRAARAGRVTWADILTEEFYEALAETEPVALRTELVQVAAVCVAWVEALDRRA